MNIGHHEPQNIINTETEQISYDIFISDCQHFEKISKDNGDNWKVSRQGNITWLEYTKVQFIKRENSQIIVHSTFEIHYSFSYGVPVLYCRYNNEAGELLDYETVKGSVLDVGVTNDMVSMAPHPVTGLPWLQVHPCRTASTAADIRHSVNTEKCSYLATFISLYGQAVGLTLSPVYAVPNHDELPKS